MKTLLHNSKIVSTVFILFSLFFVGNAFGQTPTLGDYRSKTTNTVTVNWSSLATWERYNGSTWVQPTVGEGYPGQNSVPTNVSILTGSLDDLLTTASGGIVTLDVTPTNSIGNLFLGAGLNGVAAYLNFSSTNSLTVTGNTTIYGASGNGGDKTINVGSGTLTVNGNILMGNTGNNNSNRQSRLLIGTGTVNVLGDIQEVSTDGVLASPNASSRIVFSGAGVINLSGNMTIASQLLIAPSTGTFNYLGSGNQTVRKISGILYNNLNINKTAGTATLEAAIAATDVTGDFNIQGGTFNNGGLAIVGNAGKTFSVSNGATLLLSGTTSAFPSGFGTRTLGATSTVNYSGSGAQTVVTLTYGNLALSNAGTKTFSALTTITNDLSISGTAKATFPNTTISTANTLTLDGNSMASGTYGGTGSGATNINTNYFNATTNGRVSIAAGSCTTGNWLGGTSTDWNTAANWCGGVPTSSTNVVILAGTPNQPTIGAAGGVCNNITINTGATLTMGGAFNLTVNGDFTNNGTFTPSVSNSVVIFNGTTQAINGTSGTTFRSLTIKSTSTTTANTAATVSAGSTFTIENSGTYNHNNNTTTIFNGTNTFGATSTVVYNFAGGQSIFDVASPGYGNLTLAGTGTKTAATGLDIQGNVLISSTFAAGTSLTHNVAGDWTNNGTFSFTTGSTINFNGNNALQTISGSSTTGFGNITVAKTSQSNILEVTGLITLSGGTNPLSITSGTFKLSSASTIAPFTSGAGATIPTAGGFWNNGGTISGGAYSWTNNGLFRNSSGGTTIGNATGNSFTNSSSGTFEMLGGTVNIAGRIINSGGSATISGGTMNICTVGLSNASNASFEMTATANLTMTSGSPIIAFQNANGSTGGDLLITSGAGTKNITNGTFQFGNASTPASQVFLINSNVSLSNITVNGTNSPVARPRTNSVTLSGNVTINSGGTYDLATNSLNTTLGGNWTNNGTFLANNSTIDFNGSGSANIGTSNFNNITFSGAGTKTATGALTIAGNVNITNNFTAGSFTHNVAGNWANNGGTFTNTGSTINMNGTAQNIGGTTASDFNNLVLSNSGIKTFDFVTAIAGDLAINGSASATFNATGNTANTLTLGTYGQNSGTWGGTGTGATFINTTYFNAPVTPTNKFVTIATGSCSTGTWLGTTSTDWGTAANWCGGVPTASTNVVIPSGTAFQPTIGAASVCNNITINSGATLIISGSNTLNVSGNWSNSGTFTANSSTVTYDGTNQTVGIETYNNLVITTSGTKTFPFSSNTLTVNGNLTISGSAAVTCTGIGATSLISVAGNLALSGTSSFTIPNGTSGTVNVTGTVSVGNGTTFSPESGSAYSFGNTFTVDGTVSKTAGASGTITIVGLLTVSSTGIWSNTINSSYNLRGGITNSGTFTAGSGTYTFNTNGQALTGTLSIPNVTVTGVTLTNNGSLTVSTALAGTGNLTNPGTLNTGGTISVTTLDNSGTITHTGAGNITTVLANFTNTGTINLQGSGTIAGITNNAAGIVNLTNSGTITSFNNATSTSTLNISDLTVPTFTTLTTSVAGNTVNYNGAGGQTVRVNAYSNLGLSGSGAKTVTGLTTINGDFTMGGTATAAPNLALTIGGNITLGSGTTFTGGNLTHNLAGNWINNGGTFNNTNSTINMNGTTQSIGGTTNTTFNNLILANSGVKSLDRTTIIAGNLSITGTATATFNATGNTANTLALGGFGQNAGTWGGTGTGATFINTTYFNAPVTPANKFVTIAAGSCTAGTWLGTTSTSWSTGANWCGGTVPTSATNVVIPSGTAFQPVIGSAAVCNNITLNSGSTLAINSTLGVSGNWTNNGSTISGSGTVTLSGTCTIGGTASTTFPANLTITGTVSQGINTNVTGDFTQTAGTYNVSSSSNNYTLAITGNFSVSGGSFNVSNGTNNSVLNVGGTFGVSNGTVTLIQNTNSTGATITVTGDTSISNTGILMFENNSAPGVAVFNANANVSLTGSGTNYINFGFGTSTNNAFNIKGNFTKSGTGNIHVSSATAVKGFVFVGPSTSGSPQTLSYSGTASTYHDYTVNSGAYVKLLTNLALGTSTTPPSTFTIDGILDAQTFVISGSTAGGVKLNSGATLVTANTGGVTSTITATTPTYNSAANYVFNGTANQSTNFSIATMNNLTIANTGSGGANTVTITTAAPTVNGTLAVTNGILNAAAFQIIGNASNAFTLASGTTFRLSGAYPTLFTFGNTTFDAASTVEYYGATQSVSNTPTYGKLTITTAGTKTAAGALTIAGDLTINSGATFAGGSFTHNVAGNWVNNSGTFTANSSTINLNGTTQSITGSATTFNNLTLATSLSTKTFGVETTITGNLTINTDVKADLGTFQSTSATLTLGGTAQGTGTSYGGTGSPAANINTTFFENDSGYLNVGSCSPYSLTSTAAAAAVCAGGTATINVANSNPANLPNGTYTVFYTLTGTNTGSFSTTMTVSGGTGTGSFTTTGLSNTGATTITIDYLRIGCVSKTNSGNTASITINALPAAGSLTPTPATGTICAGISVSATATAGSGGAGTIVDELEVSLSGGSYAAYTSGTPISTSGQTSVSIRTRRTATGSGCTSSTYNTVTWTISNANTWTGAANTTSWTTGGNWSCGIPPIAVTDVTISSSSFYPEISSNETINSLTLASGTTLKVNATYDLTVTDVIANAGTLTIENNANLLQTNNVANTGVGSTVVKRNSSALKRLDYTLWSSPVTGQGLYAFSKFTLPNRFYVYNTATNLYSNSVGFSLTGLQYPSPLVAPNGVNGTDTANVPFITGKGYLIRVPYNHPTAPAVYNGTFTGVPNNGDITYTMTDAGAGKRFNLVGNPYPSPISMTQFVSDNTSKITGTLYFWRETNNNTSNNAYCTWAGGTFTSNNEAQVFNPNGIIRTGQGFFVEALASQTALNFKNGQRSSDNSNQFFKNGTITNSPVTVETNRFWLNLTNTAGAFCQMAAGYMTDATDGVDIFDGKNINTGNVLLNSILNNEDYTIQGKSLPFNTADVIPLSCKITDAGNYTIALDHVDGLFTGGTQPIYLKDNLTATYQDLNTGSYTFASTAGTFTNRFEIVYTLPLGIENPVFSANNVIIYSQNNEFVVNTGNIIMSSIKVFDIRGRLLQEKNNINSGQTTIGSGLANQVLLVQITSEDGVVVTKKVVR